MKQKENKTLYFFKALACISVIAIHAPLPKYTMEIIHLARFAVPFFFIVTGYFVKLEEEVLKRKIKSSFKLLLYSGGLYFILNIVVQIKNQNIVVWFENLIQPNILFKVFVTNWTTPLLGVGHIWYLSALFYDYILLFFALKYVKKCRWNFCAQISIVSSGAMIIFSCINNMINPCFMIEDIYWRNFLFLGMPCVILGMYIRKIEFVMPKIKIGHILVLSSLVCVMCVGEHVILGDEYQIYLSSIAICIIMFIVAIKVPDISIAKKIGKEYSRDMYILHYAIIVIINEFLPLKILNYIKPVIFFAVLFTTLLLSILLCFFRDISKES